MAYASPERQPFGDAGWLQTQESESDQFFARQHRARANRGRPVTARDDELRVRPGRVRDGGRRGGNPQSFVGEVVRAARKAGHTGPGLGLGARRSGSGFGRGRAAAAALALRSPHRRVVIKARVVRQRGTRFRSAPLTRHLDYLQRDGVTRDGKDARMFDARGDAADVGAFAERCQGDRHHFASSSRRRMRPR